jgi:hypothetical protein
MKSRSLVAIEPSWDAMTLDTVVAPAVLLDVVGNCPP